MARPRRYVYGTYAAAYRECGSAWTLCVYAVCLNIPMGHHSVGDVLFVVASDRPSAMGRLMMHFQWMTAEYAARPEEMGPEPGCCAKCEGAGRVPPVVPEGERARGYWSWTDCPDCKGYGRTWDPARHELDVAPVLNPGEFTKGNR